METLFVFIVSRVNGGGVGRRKTWKKRKKVKEIKVKVEL